MRSKNLISLYICNESDKQDKKDADNLKTTRQKIINFRVLASSKHSSYSNLVIQGTQSLDSNRLATRQ